MSRLETEFPDVPVIALVRCVQAARSTVQGQMVGPFDDVDAYVRHVEDVARGVVRSEFGPRQGRRA